MHTISLCTYTREQHTPIRYKENTFYTRRTMRTIGLSLPAHHCGFAQQLDKDKENTFYI